jgi:hypothetical protein
MRTQWQTKPRSDVQTGFSCWWGWEDCAALIGNLCGQAYLCPVLYCTSGLPA